MAADERLMAPVRRFWTPEEVDSGYRAIFAAYNSRLSEVTVIIGKQTEGDSATGQVVVRDEDYLRWMEVLEARLQEIEATENNTGALPVATEHTIFSNRCLET